MSEFLPADGAFYLYADVSRFTDRQLRFRQAMLEQALSPRRPGVDFDPVRGRSFLRFSYARSAAEMHDAVAHQAMADLGCPKPRILCVMLADSGIICVRLHHGSVVDPIRLSGDHAQATFGILP